MNTDKLKLFKSEEEVKHQARVNGYDENDDGQDRQGGIRSTATYSRQGTRKFKTHQKT